MRGLVLDDVRVAYPDGPDVVRGIDLEVERGELVALIGPSGSGKSTLLRAVAGLLPLSGGRILVDGGDVAPVPVHRRAMSMMFQDHALFEHLDVADNIAYGLRRHGWSAADRSARVDELLVLVDLAGYGPRSVASLSGGQAQRVALARALAARPSVLLLDEPLASLDLVLRRQLAEEIAAIVAAEEVTTLLVTHDQTEASALAGRLAVLHDGRLVQVGTPSEVWQRPGSRFVAEFLGHVNLWPRADGGTTVVPVDALRAVTDRSGDVTVAVQRSTFDEGRRRIVGRPTGGAVVPGSVAQLTLFTDLDPSIGDSIDVVVDRSRFVELGPD